MNTTKRTNKRGSAILLTLGILSMALVMGMCFAFSARTNLQTAAISSDQTKARLLAESGLAKVMAILQDLGRKNSDETYAYPPRRPSDPTAHPYAFATISDIQYMASTSSATNVPNKTLLTHPTDDMDTVLKHVLPSLQALPSGTGKFQPIYGSSANNKIIGRVGFIVIDDSDKIDINQTISCKPASEYNLPYVQPKENNAPFLYTNQGNAFTTANDNAFHYILTPDKAPINNSTINTIRLGYSPQEVNIDNRKDYAANRAGNGASPAAQIPYMSYDHLRQAVSSFYSDDYKKYTFFSGKDIEAYWDGTELQRFDLSGYEWKTSEKWDNWTTPGLCPDSGWNQSNLKDSRNLVEKLYGTNKRPNFYNGDGTLANTPQINETGFGIPYLSTLSDAIKPQIAANMVDFCDIDNEVTFAPHTNPLEMTASPTYCGNENAPALNEFAANFTLMKVCTNPDAAADVEKTFTYSLSLKTYLELLNIYPDLGYQTKGNTGSPYHDGTAQVRIRGTISTQVGDITLDPPAEFIKTCTWKYEHKNAGVRFVPVTAVTDAGNAAAQEIDVPLTYPAGVTGPFPNSQTVTVTIDITNVNMVLFKDTNNNNQLDFPTEILSYTDSKCETIYDIAVWNGTKSVSIPSTSLVAGTGMPWVMNLQCVDPRYNHVSSSWTTPSPGPTLGDAIATACPTLFGVIPEGNSAVNPVFTSAISSTGNDKEGTVDFSTSGVANTFSTAFIPNRPFVSIWELGCIHRGESFKTLAIMTKDKKITDQVKIGPLKVRYDTFNPNSSNPKSFLDLFKQINISRTYWATYPIPATKPSGYAGPAENETPTITSISSAVWNEVICDRNRSTFADALEKNIITNSTWNTLNKRQQDALFGRTVGFLSTRYCKYSILVVADALQEIEGATETNWSTLSSHILNPITITLNSTTHYLSRRSTQRILAHVVHDTWKNKLEVVQLEYLKE